MLVSNLLVKIEFGLCAIVIITGFFALRFGQTKVTVNNYILSLLSQEDEKVEFGKPVISPATDAPSFLPES